MMPYRAAIVATAAIALVLSGCDETPSNASSDDGDSAVVVNMSANESGDVSVKIPGFEAKLRVPGEMMTGGKFDINGVSLFPGSNVTNVKIVSGDQPFSMTFDAPATPAKVATWFQDRFAEKSIKTSTTPSGLSGTTNDGERFTIDLVAADQGRSTGTIVVGSGKN